MTDIKLFAKYGNELKEIRNIVKCFSDGIVIDFGLDKYEKLTFTERLNCRNRFNRSSFYDKY